MPTPDWMKPDPNRVPKDLQTDVPHSARIYDYILGGKDNFPADRAVGDLSLAEWPGARTSMQQNRYFMTRAVRHLATEVGIRQFLDVGTGLPTSPNLHEVVQEVAPESRVVYVDNDPIVLAHARALLASSPQGRTTYIDADFRTPDAILNAPEFVGTLDLTQPVALSVIAVIQFFPNDVAYDLVQRLLEPLPSGSHLVLTASTDVGPGTRAAHRTYNEQGIFVMTRTQAEVEKFFEGLDVIEPGIVAVQDWYPDEKARNVEPSDSAMIGGVARKP